MLKKINEKFGNKYDTSNLEYVAYESKVCLICPKHGEFWQTPHQLSKGFGCGKCGHENTKRNIPTEEEKTNKFIKKAKEKFGDSIVALDETKFIDYNTKLKIGCKKHGVVEVIPKHFLYDNKGFCEECEKEKVKENGIEFIRKAKKLYGNSVIYDEVDYVNSKTKVKLTCSKHGVFYMTPNLHLRGESCPKCGHESTRLKLSRTREEFIQKSIEANGDKFSYEDVIYVNNKTKVKLKCNKCGRYFNVSPFNHLICHSGCPYCHEQSSRWEKEVRNFVVSLGVDVIANDRNVLKRKRNRYTYTKFKDWH